MDRLTTEVDVALVHLCDEGSTIEAGGYYMFTSRITRIKLRRRGWFFGPKLTILAPGKCFIIRGSEHDLEQLKAKIEYHASLFGV